jgi:hypothetical protein
MNSATDPELCHYYTEGGELISAVRGESRGISLHHLCLVECTVIALGYMVLIRDVIGFYKDLSLL